MTSVTLWDVTEFVTHLMKSHDKNSELIECQQCDYKAIIKEGMQDHLETDHVELAVLGHLAANQNTMGQSFDKFKDIITDLLSVIIADHNKIKQELSNIRKNKKIGDQKLASSIPLAATSKVPDSSPTDLPTVPKPTKPSYKK